MSSRFSGPGARPADAARFASVEEFYAADERRRYSGECDFGCFWRGFWNGPLYRISAVKNTGEIYAVRLVAGDAGGKVEVLAAGLTSGSYDDAELLLDGWSDRCGEADSLVWARDRLGRRLST